MGINSAYNLVHLQMQEFRQRYQAMMVLHADERVQPFLSSVCNRTGKQLRPLTVLLSAAANGGITDYTYQAAMVMEMIHGSSIIHDDVVDNGMLRRGFPSINANYGNQVAVLLGDYVIAQCLEIIASNTYMVQLLAKVTRKMTEGELLQLQYKNSFSITEYDYYEIIKNKTAMLFSACFEAGTWSAQTCSPQLLQQWAQIGMLFGMLFQMCDDMSDYYTKEHKKDNHKDITEHKVTLPLIMAMKHCSLSQKKELEQLYLHHQNTLPEMNTICNLVSKYGGMEHTMGAIMQKRQEIVSLLQELKPSIYVTALVDITDYVIQSINQ